MAVPTIQAIMNAPWTPTTTGRAYLTAAATGSGISLTSLSAGNGHNWPVSVAVTESESAPMFTASATDMAGGTAAYAGASAGGSYTTLVYTPGGGKLATYTNGSLVAAEIPLPGGGTAMYNAAGLNTLRHADWLGSSRLATTWAHAVYSKTAYAPFGETYNTAGSPDASFTGEDADTTSGAYNFLFRKLDPVAGRWLSPDPSGLAYADLSNPQSLNLYAYVLNNPLADFDPTGLFDSCSEDSYGYDYAGNYGCIVPDASYNGPPPGESIVPPSFAAAISNVITVNGRDVVVTETTRESGCVPTQGLQNSATGCGYQPGAALASYPNWYFAAMGVGEFTPSPGTQNSAPVYIYTPTVKESIFQIETDPFFSQQAPQTQYIPTVHCWVTSKPNALTVTVKCKRY